MRNILYIFFISVFLFSCTVKKNENQVENINQTQNLIQSGSEENEYEINDNSGSLDGSGLVDLGLNVDAEGIYNVDTIEVQYCKSKGGKVQLVNDDKICFITDEMGLLKCDLTVFYMDKCRDKTAIIKNDIVVDFVKPLIKETNKLETLSSIPKSESSDKSIQKTEKSVDLNQKWISEINLGNGFIFKEDQSSKYVYLGEKLVAKVQNTGKIMMGLNNGKIFPFNVYLNKTDSEPSKVVNINISNNSLNETITKFGSQKSSTGNTQSSTGSINIFTGINEKIDEIKENDSVATKSRTGLSGTYYINKGTLNLKTGSGDIIKLFSTNDIGADSVDLYDFELLVNKQVKVLYYPGNSKVLEEKIIDLNNILPSN